MGEFDGTAFPLSYLLLQTTNSSVTDGKRVIPLINWFEQLGKRGLKPQFLLTDKDTAQISAAKIVSGCAFDFTFSFLLRLIFPSGVATGINPTVFVASEKVS